MATMSGSGNIKVVCRFRPINGIETAEGKTESIVHIDSDDTVKLDLADYQDSFTFDRVFGMDSKQQEVFEYSIKSTVDDILNGYNGTVFAYGQTGAGKSFTMMGADLENRDLRGIIPRIVDQVFVSISKASANMEYTVKVSYMEIYMERIRDLLVPSHDNLAIHEEKSRGVYVKGLLEIYVGSVTEVYQVLHQGGQARAVSSTNMNAESSRSHSIFVITITQKELETGSAKSGQLFLVDLAGSEKVGKTGASGQTLEEAKKINKSLSALGMVINALTDGKSTHIPYRDSKLTRILQESLGGNSRTTLIINCSPSAYNDQETLSTLRFGMRAKCIKNKAKINVELSPTELRAHLRKARAEIVSYHEYASNLEVEVNMWRKGEFVTKEQWTLTRADTSQGVSQLTPAKKLVTELGREFVNNPDSRSLTPLPGSINLEKDERDEFLRRENELQDQLAEKESLLVESEKAVKEIRAESESLREHDQSTCRDHENLLAQYHGLKIGLEKVNFECKEANITLDTFRETNYELNAELEDTKKALIEAKIGRQTVSGELSEEQAQLRKSSKMKSMMASFVIPASYLDLLQQAIDDVGLTLNLTPAQATALNLGLERIKDIAESNHQFALSRDAVVASLTEKKLNLENRLSQVVEDYQQLLETSIKSSGAFDIEGLKLQLSGVYQAKRSDDQGAAAKDCEIERLWRTIEDLKATDRIELDRGIKVQERTVADQLSDFDKMKKSLMRDLQNRCERVVELEISLDETREQYNSVLRNTNNRAQQKKMAFLERNLEQLTSVQRQNSSLKKEVAIAERKLIARNERISSLETLLQEAQEKLTQQNHKFETQLQAVRERLEQARTKSPNEISGSFTSTRIAKPLRGGGSVGVTNDLITSLNPLKDSPRAFDQKRSSWFGR